MPGPFRRPSTRLAVLAAVVWLLSAGSAQAQQFRINELFADAPGGDNGQEFFEIRNVSGGAAAMTNLWLLVVEGDGAAAGTVDQAFNLGGFSTGTNGLFLWRDAATVLNPARRRPPP